MRILTENRGVLVTAVVALAVGIASYAVVRSDPYAERTNRLFMFDVSSLYEVDSKLIQFEQAAEFKVAMKEIRSISVGPGNRVYVAGDKAVHVFSPDGAELSVIAIEGRPSCLAVGADSHHSPGRIYVGAGKRIEVFAPDGAPVEVWKLPDADTIIASIAVADRDVFVADAGNRVVLRYDETGQLAGKIGEAGNGRTFNVPSSYFDIAISTEGLLHVANPGALRIESYTFDGEMEIRWGEAGSGIADFFGCCNPSHFAVLPNGGIVTSEKGVPRVKVYSEFGEFESVVAGPAMLGIAESELGDPRSVQAKAVFEVATDSQGRILVLDPRRRSVRIFQRIDNTQGVSDDES